MVDQKQQELPVVSLPAMVVSQLAGLVALQVRFDVYKVALEEILASQNVRQKTSVGVKKLRYEGS